jgi:uncharacterized protein
MPAKPLPPEHAALMLQCCLDCGRHRFPPARYCPQCRSERMESVQASGQGVLESWCTFHKAYWPEFERRVPYDVVQVRLDEGVRVFSNLIGGAPRIGLRVKARFEDGLVKFAPA